MPHRSKPSSAALALIAVAVSTPLIICAQTFEVASVKANTSGEKRGRMQMNLPDSFVSTNLPLRSTISIVYQVPVYKMSGGPAWIDAETFDIAAKADHRLTQDEKLAMIRALLEDRFKLKTHREHHDGRIYALVVARADRALGPSLKPSTLDCTAIVAERERTGAPPRRTGGSLVPDCGALLGPAAYGARGTQISSFATSLGAMIRETIVDDTGLTGWWDLRLEGNLTGRDLPPGPGGASPEKPSVFTALQEQLGLKLEPRRGPIETFVIDSAERPMSD